MYADVFKDACVTVKRDRVGFPITSIRRDFIIIALQHDVRIHRNFIGFPIVVLY